MILHEYSLACPTAHAVAQHHHHPTTTILLLPTFRARDAPLFLFFGVCSAVCEVGIGGGGTPHVYAPLK